MDEIDQLFTRRRADLPVLPDPKTMTQSSSFFQTRRRRRRDLFFLPDPKSHTFSFSFGFRGSSAVVLLWELLLYQLSSNLELEACHLDGTWHSYLREKKIKRKETKHGTDLRR